jgi:hypothetical protein
MLGSFAALSQQLFRERNALGQILSGAFPGALDALLLRGDAQFVVFQLKQNLVADFDPEGLAKGCGYHHASILADSYPGLLFQGRAPNICQDYTILSKSIVHASERAAG